VRTHSLHFSLVNRPEHRPNTRRVRGERPDDQKIALPWRSPHRSLLALLVQPQPNDFGPGIADMPDLPQTRTRRERTTLNGHRPLARRHGR
jgi:hypothetical protein